MAYQMALAALGDPTRRRILERIARSPMAVGDLAATLPVTRPAVSQHLKVLKNARLVRERRAGTRRIYSVDLNGLSDVRRYLDRFWGDVLSAFKSEAEASGDPKGEGDE